MAKRLTIELALESAAAEAGIEDFGKVMQELNGIIAKADGVLEQTGGAVDGLTARQRAAIQAYEQLEDAAKAYYETVRDGASEKKQVDAMFEAESAAKRLKYQLGELAEEQKKAAEEAEKAAERQKKALEKIEEERQKQAQKERDRLQAEFTGWARRAQVMSSAGRNTEQLGKSIDATMHIMRAGENAGRALSQLMSGNFVGAMKSARIAVKELWMAISTNPIVAAVVAIGAAVAFITRKVLEARNAAKEAAAVKDELRAKIGADVMGMRLEKKKADNINGVGSLEDADLEEKLAFARKRAKDYSLDKVTSDSFESEQALQNWKDQKQYWESYAKALADEKAAREKAKAAMEKADREARESSAAKVAEMDEALANLNKTPEQIRDESLAKKKKELEEFTVVWGEDETGWDPRLLEKKRALELEIAKLEKQKADKEAAEKKESEGIYRQDTLARISDPIARMRKEVEYLKQDLQKAMGDPSKTENDRLKIVSKIRDIERDISKEKQKQADDEAKARKALRESIEDYDAQGDRQAQYQLARKRAKEALAAVEAARLNVRMNDTAENREALLDAQKEAVSAMQTYRSAREAAMEDAAGDTGPIDPSDRAALARRARAKADAADAEVRRASHGFVATQGGGKFWTRNNSLSFDMLNRQAQARALAERLERGGSVWEGLGSMGADGRRWVGRGSIGQALARKAEEMKLAEESPEKQMAKNVEKSKDFLEEIRDLLK